MAAQKVSRWLNAIKSFPDLVKFLYEVVQVALIADLTAIRAPLAGVLSASVTWDPGSLATAAQESKDITVTGAAVGDFVLVSAPVDVADLMVSAQVTAADTVTVTIANVGAANPTDLATGTWRVRVIPQSSFAAPAALNLSA